MSSRIRFVFSVAAIDAYEIPGTTMVGPATAKGTLHDHDGFPAVVHGGHGTVSGTLWVIDDEHLDTALSMIDRIHGIGADGSGSGHVRTIVNESQTLLAFAWHWTGAPPSEPIADGRWTVRHPSSAINGLPD